MDITQAAGTPEFNDTEALRKASDPELSAQGLLGFRV